MTLDLPALDYVRFLAALKERIRGARVSAGVPTGSGDTKLNSSELRMVCPKPKSEP
jgi:hypothetical protein